MKKVMVTLEAATSKEKLQEIQDYWLPFYKRTYNNMLHGTGCKSFKDLVKRMKGRGVDDPEKEARWNVWRFMPHQAKYGEEDTLLYGVSDAEIDTILKKLVKEVTR